MPPASPVPHSIVEAGRENPSGMHERLSFQVKRESRLHSLNPLTKLLLDGRAGYVLGQEETLAQAQVEPPQLTRLGRRLGLKTTVKNQEEFLSALRK